MTRVENVSYWRGKSTSIPEDTISGRILVCDDTGEVFLDFADPSEGKVLRVQLTDNRKFDKAGGTFTGVYQDSTGEHEVDVILARDPRENLGAATKQYVDVVDSKFDNHNNDEVRHITADERFSWNNKVDKIEGKGLSTNDYTNEEKSKLADIYPNSTKVSFESSYVDDEEGMLGYYDIGTITINDVEYTIYSPIVVNISGNANTATTLQIPRKIDGVEFSGGSDITHFGECGTPSDIAAKVVSIPNYNLVDGANVKVYFHYPITTENSTLNVSNTGAKPIVYRGDAIGTTQITVGLWEFSYRNECYELLSSVDTIITYENATTESSGLMSSQDKTKLDSIDPNAEPPIPTNAKRGGVIVGENITLDSETGIISVTSENIQAALSDEFTFSAFIGATDTRDGVSGLVTTPLAGDNTKYLKGDGSWSVLTPYVGATEVSGGVPGAVPPATIGEKDYYLKGDGTWSEISGASVDTITVEEIDEICISLPESEMYIMNKYPGIIILKEPSMEFTLEGSRSWPQESYKSPAPFTSYENPYYKISSINQHTTIIPGIKYAAQLPDIHNYSSDQYVYAIFDGALSSQIDNTNIYWIKFPWSTINRHTTITGKNLLPTDKLSLGVTRVNGITVTKYENGSIKLQGTATANGNIVLSSALGLRRSTYTLSTGTLLPGTCSLAVVTQISPPSVIAAYDATTFTASIEGRAEISFSSGAVLDTVIYPQLEIGSSATSYEPYTVTIAGTMQVSLHATTGNEQTLSATIEGINVSLPPTYNEISTTQEKLAYYFDDITRIFRLTDLSILDTTTTLSIGVLAYFGTQYLLPDHLYGFEIPLAHNSQSTGYLFIRPKNIMPLGYDERWDDDSGSMSTQDTRPVMHIEWTQISGSTETVKMNVQIYHEEYDEQSYTGDSYIYGTLIV